MKMYILFSVILFGGVLYVNYIHTTSIRSDYETIVQKQAQERVIEVANFSRMLRSSIVETHTNPSPLLPLTETNDSLSGDQSIETSNINTPLAQINNSLPPHQDIDSFKTQLPLTNNPPQEETQETSPLLTLNRFEVDEKTKSILLITHQETTPSIIAQNLQAIIEGEIQSFPGTIDVLGKDKKTYKAQWELPGSIEGQIVFIENSIPRIIFNN